jgi:NAD(P)-dependent dehydrogenase (short-subunit alcohol dehydrogenase family)
MKEARFRRDTAATFLGARCFNELDPTHTDPSSDFIYIIPWFTSSNYPGKHRDRFASFAVRSRPRTRLPKLLPRDQRRAIQRKTVHHHPSFINRDSGTIKMSAEIPKIDANSLFNVNGLVAVITGGGSGLGAMMARALAVNGAAKVFIIGRREASLKDVASSLPGITSIVPLVGDVTSKESLKNCVEQVKQQVSYIDVLVPNSGIAGPPTPAVDDKQQPLPFEKFVENMFSPTPAEVTQTYAVNITGVHFTIAAFLPLLNEANKKRPSPSTEENFTPRPQIITTSSIGGFSRKSIGSWSYGPSKAAVTHLTKMLATALVPYDIRCNTIAPGLYLTEMTGGMYDRQEKTKTHNVEGTFPKDVVPATRTGDEKDLAGVILWLCGRSGAYLNGTVVVTDGGRLSVMPATY